jgi:hypothetical protein
MAGSLTPQEANRPNQRAFNMRFIWPFSKATRDLISQGAENRRLEEDNIPWNIGKFYSPQNRSENST